MTAQEMIIARARPWLLGDRRDLVRAAILSSSFVLVWSIAAIYHDPRFWFFVVVYSGVQLLLCAIRGLSKSTSWLNSMCIWSSVLIDLGAALVLATGVYQFSGSILAALFLISLRLLSNFYYPSILTLPTKLIIISAVLSEFLFILVPVGMLSGTRTQWWFAIIALVAVVMLVLRSERKNYELSSIQRTLQNERQSSDTHIGELERTANELRARLREQRNFEEGLRVITSSLRLDEVLSQIVDSTFQTLGRDRIDGVALSLSTNGVLQETIFSNEGSGHQPWAARFAERIMSQQVPLVVSDTLNQDEFTALLGRRMRSAVSVPLYIGETSIRGALTVVSRQPAAFSSGDTRLLSAFAVQAGIAIANAEMHKNIRQQQLLLEAVIRDMSDGLLVFNDKRELVLANRVGQAIIDSDSSDTMLENLRNLAAETYINNQSNVVAELRVEEGQNEEQPQTRFFQAYASHVQSEDNQHLVAIVLQDVSRYREEEQERSDFISMVSHELRNPLHSLNGFLKVVLQGRAGPLQEMQQDFLQMADTQVDLLKGRINELLEFNRVKAGRLSIHPELNNLARLVTSTTNRLSMQADQHGLTLRNLVHEDLPNCCFDYERIGQVLTNLIENAIKATPSGGHITVESKNHEQEVWISVSDTGVGIAPENIDKIFNRFYRANQQKSNYGVHLGLGLSICQQIIEGHGGRIWVESEEHAGSTFLFALPLAAQAAPVEFEIA